MGDFFKSLSAGFSRFVLAWFLPSATTVVVFVVFVYPDLSSSPPLRRIAKIMTDGPVGGVLVLSFTSLLLGMLFSLASRPIYRILEGYNLPESLRRPLLRRQLRRWNRLQAEMRRTPLRLTAQRGRIRERLDDYPTRRDRILPTRLGNAFKALETFGVDRWGLDSQTFWYELNAVVPERLRRDVDDARASVDFFISFVAHLSLLSAVSILAAAVARSPTSLLAGVITAALIKPAYDAAVRNMTDWRYSVQALVNLGRVPLAKGLGYEIPVTLTTEQRLWQAWGQFVRNENQHYLSKMNEFKAVPVNMLPSTDISATSQTNETR